MEIYSQCPLTIEPHKWQNPVYQQSNINFSPISLPLDSVFQKIQMIWLQLLIVNVMCAAHIQYPHRVEKKDELYADFAYLGFMFNLPENRKIIVLMFQDGGSTKLICLLIHLRMKTMIPTSTHPWISTDIMLSDYHFSELSSTFL